METPLFMEEKNSMLSNEEEKSMIFKMASITDKQSSYASNTHAINNNINNLKKNTMPIDKTKSTLEDISVQ